VAIEVRGREDVGFVDGGALGFVGRWRRSVIEMSLELGIDVGAGFRRRRRV